MRLRPRLRPWMFVSAAWLVVVVLAALNEIVQRRLAGETWGAHDIVFAGSGGWLILALLTPALFALSARWPIAEPHVARRVLLHLGFSLLFWAVASILYQVVLAGVFNHHATDGATTTGELLRQLGRRAAQWAFNTLPAGFVVYAASLGIEHAVRYFAQARDREVQVARLAEQLAGARFAALQSQLNPHFLFNTLNTIAVRARDGDGLGTARMVERLSEVLRRTLGGHRANEVTLDEELELVREYLAIEQARFSDRLRPTFEIDHSALCAAVPSFALQHLVENAIRHGITKQPGSGRVSIVARRDGSALALSVSDDGPGIDATVAARDGHGLGNTRERLRALYGARASLDVATGATGGTIARLRIPYHEMSPESAVA